jgi:TonB family protein
MDARTEARTYSFTVLSTVLHVGMAIGVTYLKIELPQQPELTQIEIVSSEQTSTALPISEAPVVAETLKAPDTAPEAPLFVAKESSAPPVQEESIPEPAAAVLVTSKPVKHATKAPAKPAKAVAPAPKEVAAVLPVVENTELDETTDVQAQTELVDEDLDEDLSKIDQEETSKVAAVHEELSKETDQELKEQETKIAALQKETEAASEKMAKESAEKRAQEKQALAAATKASQDAEKARQGEIARQQAVEKARQAEAARQAEQARINADKQAAAAAAAIAAAQAEEQRLAAAKARAQEEQIRSLAELRQMPGNQKPLYDSQDRLLKRQGEVSFLAYVSREGSLVQFKMVKSSGHRELDAKTLKSIKSWRFFPGQEGWVEIPYNWNLKGEPQVMPATLRRRAQVTSNNR